jgi:hypothetical protein
MATIRVNVGDAPDAVADFEAASDALAFRIAALDGVTGAHFGVAASATTRVKTKESELRHQTGEEVFDAVVMVEGTERREIEAAVGTADSLLRAAVAIRSAQSAVYDLAYLLGSED